MFLADGFELSGQKDFPPCHRHDTPMSLVPGVEVQVSPLRTLDVIRAKEGSYCDL